VFGLRALPRRIAIVGGGYIAAEMAGLLRGLDADVTLLVRGANLLGHFDPDLASIVTESMRDRGIELRCKTLVAGLERTEDGAIRVLCTNGGSFDGFDWVLWAIGRRPNTDGIGLEEAGVALTPAGHVEIDADQNTNVPGVYAIGDVGTQPALTPVAIAAGRRLAERLFGSGGVALPAIDPDLVPTVVFSHPPVASCGLTEPQARQRHGESVRVYTTRFRPMREALAQRDEHLFAKLVCCGDDERVVGLHMIGPGVDEILQGFAVAIRMGATRRDFNDTIAIHPTTAEEISLLGA
jgi:glutathione reductase (NADPH)